MSEATWAFLATEITTIGAVFIAWLQVRKPVKRLGNGFSDRVEDNQATMKRNQAEMKRSLDGISDLLSDTHALAVEARDEIREHKNAHILASMRGKP